MNSSDALFVSAFPPMADTRSSRPAFGRPAALADPAFAIRARHGMLLFIHVPKTGGATLNRILVKQHAPWAVWTLDHRDVRRSVTHIERRSRDELDFVECVTGHMPFGLHARFARPAASVTLLRHPVHRLASHYRHARSHPEHYLHRQVHARGLDLEAYVRSGLSAELDNGATRLLSGLSPDWTGPVPRDALDRAKANLRDHFVAVGITERFDESLLLFRKLFGWHSVCYLKENVSHGARRTGLSRSARRAIERSQELDVDLYEFAAGRLRAQLRESGPDARELARFRRRNELYQAAWGPVMRTRQAVVSLARGFVARRPAAGLRPLPG